MNGDICLYLLTQVFLIIHQTKLVTPLAKFLFDNDFSVKYQVKFINKYNTNAWVVLAILS